MFFKNRCFFRKYLLTKVTNRIDNIWISFKFLLPVSQSTILKYTPRGISTDDVLDNTKRAELEIFGQRILPLQNVDLSNPFQNLN